MDVESTGPKIYTFLASPGHGWLQVPLADIDALGIENRISGFSYLTDIHVYLEEN